MHARIGTFPLKHKSTRYQFGHHLSDEPRAVPDFLFEQPPLDDAFQSVVAFGVLDQIGQDVVRNTRPFFGARVPSLLCLSALSRLQVSRRTLKKQFLFPHAELSYSTFGETATGYFCLTHQRHLRRRLTFFFPFMAKNGADKFVTPRRSIVSA